MPLVATHSDTNLANAPVVGGLIALAGGGNPGATLVSPGFSVFSTVATAEDSAQMQVSAPNKHYEVINYGAATLRLYVNQNEATALFVVPTGSAFTAGNHIEIAVGACARIVCWITGTWTLLN